MNDKERSKHQIDTIEGVSDFRWTFWKIFPMCLIIAIIVSVIGWGIRVASQPGSMIEKTLNADNVINNYEWFHQAYEDIQATDIKISNAQATVDQFKKDAGERLGWDFSDKDEYGRLNSVLLGLKNYRQDIVAKYNARSKMVNRKIFKGKTAPTEII